MIKIVFVRNNFWAVRCKISKLNFFMQKNAKIEILQRILLRKCFFWFFFFEKKECPPGKAHKV